MVAGQHLHCCPLSAQRLLAGREALGVGGWHSSWVGALGTTGGRPELARREQGIVGESLKEGAQAT